VKLEGGEDQDKRLVKGSRRDEGKGERKGGLSVQRVALSRLFRGAARQERHDYKGDPWGVTLLGKKRSVQLIAMSYENRGETS